MDQEKIGAELGLRLPKKGRQFFKDKKIKFLSKEPRGGFGTQIEKAKYSIQSFFEKYKIALNISKLFTFKEAQKLDIFIKDHIKKNNDIIIRYNNTLLRKGQKGYGHFSLIVEYDDRTKKIKIGDPELPFFKEVSLDVALHLMSDKIDGIERGLYVVSES